MLAVTVDCLSVQQPLIVPQTPMIVPQTTLPIFTKFSQHSVNAGVVVCDSVFLDSVA